MYVSKSDLVRWKYLICIWGKHLCDDFLEIFIKWIFLTKFDSDLYIRNLKNQPKNQVFNTNNRMSMCEDLKLKWLFYIDWNKWC